MGWGVLNKKEVGEGNEEGYLRLASASPISSGVTSAGRSLNNGVVKLGGKVKETIF